MDLVLAPRLLIPANEIQWRFSKSSGPGGPKINKTDSRVEIIFDIQKSKSLSLYQKQLINNQFKNKLINGCICITVQENRTQFKNRQLALSRLSSTLENLLKPPPKKRRETKPTRSSQRERIQSKKRRGEVKKNRQTRIEY